MQEKVGSKRFSKEKGDREKNERDEGLGQRCGNMNEKTDVLARRTNMTKVMEKAENPLHIYSEYWMQGCGERCPYLNRKTLKKRNKRNIFYMKKKCGRISGYMFCFL